MENPIPSELGEAYYHPTMFAIWTSLAVPIVVAIAYYLPWSSQYIGIPITPRPSPVPGKKMPSLSVILYVLQRVHTH